MTNMKRLQRLTLGLNDIGDRLDGYWRAPCSKRELDQLLPIQSNLGARRYQQPGQVQMCQSGKIPIKPVPSEVSVGAGGSSRWMGDGMAELLCSGTERLGWSVDQVAWDTEVGESRVRGACEDLVWLKDQLGSPIESGARGDTHIMA